MFSGQITIKSGREKSILARHPWVFSGSIEKIGGDPKTGDIVDLISSKGEFLARGFYNDFSNIKVRIATFKKEDINKNFFAGKIENAVKFRQKLNISSDAIRLFNDSGDFLSGFSADKFGEYIVVQFTSAGLYSRKELITEILVDKYNPKGIYDRSETSLKSEEGIEVKSGCIYGEIPPDLFYITEDGIKYPVLIKSGQKTGFYLDLRGVRSFVKNYAEDLSVLNLFSYTGSLSLCALESGASFVKSVESSKTFLGFLENELKYRALTSKHESVCENAFEYIRKVTNKYDMIIVDPPPLCQKKSHIDKSARAYKDINMNAMKLTEDGAMIITLCCSHHISMDLFKKIIFASAKDTGKNIRIVKTICQEPDHPVNIYHPETEYFKGLILIVN